MFLKTFEDSILHYEVGKLPDYVVTNENIVDRTPPKSGDFVVVEKDWFPYYRVYEKMWY